MSLTTIFRTYLPFFHYMGIIDYSYGSHRVIRRMSGVVFAVFLLCVGLIGMAIIVLYKWRNWDEADRVLISLYYTFGIFEMCSILIHTVFRKRFLSETNKLLLDVEKVFLKDLALRRISYNPFKSSFHWKIILIITVWSQSFLRAIMWTYYYQIGLFLVWNKLLQFSWCMIACAMIFYLEQICFFLDLLNLSIEKDLKLIGFYVNASHSMPQNSIALSIRSKLRNFKRIHFYSWMAVQRVNDHFGWTLIPFFLQLFIRQFYSVF